MVTKSTGTINSLAGDGTTAYKGDGGPATSASLCYPRGVAVDATANIYIAVTNNGRIRMVGGSASTTTTTHLSFIEMINEA